jgi:hypothetical protein
VEHCCCDDLVGSQVSRAHGEELLLMELGDSRLL